MLGLKDNFFAIFIRPEKNDKPIDGLRALAILMVAFFHTLFLTTGAFEDESDFIRFASDFPLSFGWHLDMGVDLFFILSGFLITRYLIVKQQSDKGIVFGRYFYNRLLRIVPLYVFVLALVALMGLPNSEYFWANLLFINNFLSIENMFITWSWSVSVEMQYYLVAPLLVVLAARFPLRILLGLFVLSFFIRAWVISADETLYTTTYLDMLVTEQQVGHAFWDNLYVNFYTRFGPLLLGGICAYLMVLHKAKTEQVFNSIWVWPLWLGSMALLYFMLTNSFVKAIDSEALNFVYMVVAKNSFALAASIVLLFSMLNHSLIGRGFYTFLSARIWFPISQTSYAIYFFHILFIFVSFKVLIGKKVLDLHMGDIISIYLLAVFLSFLLGILTFILIERPFLKLKMK